VDFFKFEAAKADTQYQRMIRRLLDAFTPDRCMWASDAPYQTQRDNTYQASIELIRDKLEFLSAGDKEKLLTKTAQSVYFTA